MFKTYKEWLTSKGIDDAIYKSKAEAEMASLQKEYMEYVSVEMKTAITDSVKRSEIDGLVKTADLEPLKTIANEAMDKASMAIESNKGETKIVSFRESIKAELIKNADAIKSMKTDPNGSLTIKAVGPMTFATNITGNVGRTEREVGFMDTFRRTPILLEIVNTGNTEARTFEWIEKTGREGGVAMVAEGTVKPQGDWDLTVFSQQAKKEAIIVTISKEMLEDIDGMAADIEQEVFEQVRLFTESIVLNGDGTGNNILGLNANATPYVAGAFLNTIAKANEFDVLRTAYNQVELSNDSPTAFLLHPTDAAKMELVKDVTTGQYVIPPFAAVNGTTIKGVPVRTSTLVAQGTGYVGNFQRFKVKLRSNIEFIMGYRGAAGDWEKNMVSFIGEQRLLGFIPAVHYPSIVKFDFTVGKSLLDPAVTDL